MGNMISFLNQVESKYPGYWWVILVSLGLLILAIFLLKGLVEERKLDPANVEKLKSEWRLRHTFMFSGWVQGLLVRYEVINFDFLKEAGYAHPINFLLALPLSIGLSYILASLIVFSMIRDSRRIEVS